MEQTLEELARRCVGVIDRRAHRGTVVVSSQERGGLRTRVVATARAAGHVQPRPGTEGPARGQGATSRFPAPPTPGVV